MRVAVAFAALAAVALFLLAAGSPWRGRPLWTGARYTWEDRDRAIQRGLNFIYFSIARNPGAFREYGSDLLFVFQSIAETSGDRELRRVARSMGRERAIEWRRLNPEVPAGADAGYVADLVYGASAAEALGVPDPGLRAQLRAAVARFSPADFLGFDPAREPPPVDLPEECPRCGLRNARGARLCARCGAGLTMQNPYDVLQDALICTYSGDAAGITLGAHYRDILKWVPAMRPYPRRPRDGGGDYNFVAGIYAATHIIYTYNHYNRSRISPDCFPEEFALLKRNLPEAIADRDPEILGEHLDTLRDFGLTFGDPPIRAGVEYLLAAQNRDGSWGDVKDADPYGRYHPTWTAVDGLRDYRWNGTMACPEY